MMYIMKSSPTTTANMTPTHNKVKQQVEEKPKKPTRPWSTARCPCTFCGAPMEPGDTVCEECGMPVDGVVCPQCGTRNYRTFCSHCNMPLTKAAQRVVEKAKEDPKVIQAAQLMDQAAHGGYFHYFGASISSIGTMMIVPYLSLPFCIWHLTTRDPRSWTATPA